MAFTEIRVKKPLPEVNDPLCDATQFVHYLSPTEPGSRHDKALADCYPLALPVGSVLKQDLGFLGHQPVGVLVEMPIKKPKNKDITCSQKLYNQLFNATRVLVEPANSGLKRLRMFNDVCRVHGHAVRDRIRVVACSLHNLRVVSADPARLYQTSTRLQAHVTNQSE